MPRNLESAPRGTSPLNGDSAGQGPLGAGLDGEEVRRRRPTGRGGSFRPVPGDDAVGALQPERLDARDENHSGFDTRSLGARGACVTVGPRLEVTGEVVVEQRGHDRNEGVEAQNEYPGPGPASRYGNGHVVSIDTAFSHPRACAGFAFREAPPGPRPADRPEVRYRDPSGSRRCRSASSEVSRALRFRPLYRGRPR